MLAALSREVSVSLGFILRYDSGCLSSLEHRPLLLLMVIQQRRNVLSVQKRILGGLIEMRTENERDAMRSGFVLQASGGQHHPQSTPEALCFRSKRTCLNNWESVFNDSR